jgi:predicted  nucleic acid-binding Zn-ribbon protein
MPVINKMTGMFVQIHLYEPQSLYNRDMSQTLSLYRLQQTDSQIDRVQARLLAIQKILEDDEILRQANEQVNAADKQRLDTEQSLRQAEAAVQTQRVKIEQTESSLYGGSVHNPKELQDLQNDVAALKRHFVTLEDRLLEAMLASEAAETTLQTSRSSFGIAQKHMAEQNQSLGQEQSALQKEIEKLKAERAAVAGTIPQDHLDLYDQLRQQSHGMAVAGVVDNACDVCGTTLTPAHMQATRSGGQMARCPSCGRILYRN